jgi:hypothetical protein
VELEVLLLPVVLVELDVLEVLPLDDPELALVEVLPVVPEPPWPALAGEPCAPPVAGEPPASPPQWVSPSAMISNESGCKRATRMEASRKISHGGRSAGFAFVALLLSSVAAGPGVAWEA